MCHGRTVGAILLAWPAFAWTFPAKGDLSRELQEVLRQNECRLQARITAYDGTTAKSSCVAALGDAADAPPIVFHGARWQCRCRAEAVAHRPDAVDLKVTFRLLEGQAQQTAVGAECVFAKWSADNFVVLPGAVYNGNRFRSKARSLPTRSRRGRSQTRSSDHRQ